MHYYLEVLKKYAVFKGRARRKEYWMFVLFNILASILVTIIDMAFFGISETAGIGILTTLYSLAVIIPYLAVTIRRLHDSGRSGWWFLLILIPLIGPLVVFVFTLLDSTPGENRWGDNPKTGLA